MVKVKNWEAARSGAWMTIRGNGEDGRPVKVTNVKRITRTEGGMVAERTDGEMVELL